MLTTIRSNLTLITPRIWVALTLAWLAWVYVFINFELYALFPAGWGFFAIQPLLWFSLAGMSGVAYRSLAHQPAFNRRLAQLAFLAGLLQTALFYIVSFAFSFGKSPYGHDLLTLFGNLFYIAAFTTAFEASRAFLGAALGIRNPGRALAGVAVLFALAAIPAGQFSRLADPATAFSFLGQTVLPALSRNLLATYLAMTGGPLVSASYMLTLALAEWLPPILPNPPWLVSAFLGTLFPVLALYGFNRWLAPAVSENAAPAQPAVSQRRLSGQVISWLMVGMIGLGLVGFTSGLFGVRPFLVSGGSMNPAFYAGDIVVTSPVPADQLAVGDIIRFRQQNIEIVHRIVAIQHTPAGLVFTTRGDNNNTADPPVYPQDIAGKTLYVIPRLGWLALGLRGMFS